MKLTVLAVDYDGTIAVDGVMSAEVRAALERARGNGLTVIVVTGRILGELRRVAGDLSFADAVVAENGAVVAFPRSGRSTALHIPPAPDFLRELTRRGVSFATGETVIEAEASAAPDALAAIRQLEQPLSLLFNRGRMMILPQAVSKATGLMVALDALRLSSHNVLAIGDAENDHELLRSAEIGVAVEWGSAALKKIADEILPGRGPPDVATFIDKVVARTATGGRLRIVHPRRHCVLGAASDGKEISLAVTGRNVLICGDPRSGKSWVAGLLCEELILYGYSVCVIDPEGDYASLEALPHVTVVGGEDPPPKAHELRRLLRRPDGSVVLDLSSLSHTDKLNYLQGALPQITTLRSTTGVPHRVLLDEAHYWLGGAEAQSLVDLASGGWTIVTYQASRLHPDVLHAVDVVLVSRSRDAHEARMLASVAGLPEQGEQWAVALRELSVQEVALLPGPPEAEGKLRPIRLAERLTPHVRHRMKYLDVPVADFQAFVFRENGHEIGERARTLKEFVAVLNRIGPERLVAHLTCGDFSRWIADVFGDRPLAAKIRHLEDNYRMNRVSDINGAIVGAIHERYAITGAHP
jgi:hydroxymethylpyrimidine pyrophosphatase-like HAD family hydrolase